MGRQSETDFNDPKTQFAAPGPNSGYRPSTGDLSNPGSFSTAVNPDIARAKLDAIQAAVNAAGLALKQARTRSRPIRMRWLGGIAAKASCHLRGNRCNVLHLIIGILLSLASYRSRTTAQGTGHVWLL
jgi:hypothetical protein